MQVAKEAFHLIDPDKLPDKYTLTVDKMADWLTVMARAQDLTNVSVEDQVYWVFSKRARADSPPRPRLMFVPHVRSAQFDIVSVGCSFDLLDLLDVRDNLVIFLASASGLVSTVGGGHRSCSLYVCHVDCVFAVIFLRAGCCLSGH